MDYREIISCPGHPRHPRIRGVDEPESQNFNKIQRVFRRGPSSSTGVQLFCTVPNFLQAVPTDYIEIIWCPGHPRHPRIRGVDKPESQHFNKIQRFFRRGPFFSDGVQLFCTVPNFLQAVPTRGRQASCKSGNFPTRMQAAILFLTVRSSQTSQDPACWQARIPEF